MEEKLMKVRVSANSVGTSTTVSAGKHTFHVDEPVESGGKDTGPNPLQTVLGALAGCEDAMCQMVAKEKGIQVNGIQFEIEGFVDRRGLEGNPSVNPYFQKVKIRAVVDTPESVERVEELHVEVGRRCPVYNLIKSASVEIDTQWKKA